MNKIFNGSAEIVALAVKEFAEKHNLKYKSYSDDWFFVFELNNENKRVVFGTELGIDNPATKKLVRDKSATYELLSEASIPAVPHYLVTRPYESKVADEESVKQAVELCKKFNDVVCKPNDGSAGEDVIRVNSEKEFKDVCRNLLDKHRAIAISPFLEAECEYRVTTLDGEALHIYKKEKEESALLFNLSDGGKSSEVKDENTLKNLHNLAKEASQATGIKFANIDILQTKDGKLFIMEINSQVVFTKYLKQHPEDLQKIKTIYKRALEYRFKDCV